MSRHENYLRNNLTKYQYVSKAKTEILDALKQYSDLRPKLEKFTFNNGETRDLMALGGTLPVKYLGNTYNIPIAVFMLETYPYNPPLVFVRPTSTMQIKPNKHVDSNGKVYLPYLTEWKHPDSDLSSLLSILQIVFQEMPPVFAKPSSSSTTSASRSPYPPGGGSYSSSGSQPPPYPSYSQAGPNFPGMGMPTPPTSGPTGGPASYIGSAWTSGGGGGGGGGGVGGGSSGPGYMGSYPYPPSSQPGYAQVQTHGLMGYPPTKRSLSEAELNASLRSAVEDKLKRRLREVHAEHAAELKKLERTQEQLSQRRNQLEEMISRAEKEEEEVTKALGILTEKNKEMDEILRRQEKEERINVDEAVDTTAPLYRQLFNAFAEEQAIEDALYYLAESHRKEIIDLDEFLKKVRDLSREQFMLRVTVQKCREKAGLPEL